MYISRFCSSDIELEEEEDPLKNVREASIQKILDNAFEDRVAPAGAEKGFRV